MSESQTQEGTNTVQQPSQVNAASTPQPATSQSNQPQQSSTPQQAQQHNEQQQHQMQHQQQQQMQEQQAQQQSAQLASIPIQVVKLWYCDINKWESKLTVELFVDDGGQRQYDYHDASVARCRIVTVANSALIRRNDKQYAGY